MKETTTRTVTVWFSDFRDIPGLKHRFWNLIHGSTCLKVTRVAANFLEVQGTEHLVNALYHG